MEKDNKIPTHPSSDLKVGEGNTIVQTYAEDMARIIGDNKEGLVKKIIHGEEESQIEKENLSPESKKNKLFMLVSILLVFLALAILFLFGLKRDSGTVNVEKQFTPLIFNDKSSIIEVAGLTKDEMTQAILNEVNTTSVKKGGVEGIYLTENKQIIGLRRFIALIKADFIPDNNPLLVQDNFLTGVVNSEANAVYPEGRSFFILIKVRSAADIFDSLRAWENKMLADLHGFFGVDISSATNYLFTKDFDNGIIENKNARILYDKDGKIVLMYIFADDNSVVITDTESAAHEVMLRLASGEKKQ